MKILEDNKLPDVDPVLEAATNVLEAATIVHTVVTFVVVLFVVFLAGVAFGVVCTAVGVGQ